MWNVGFPRRSRRPFAWAVAFMIVAGVPNACSAQEAPVPELADAKSAERADLFIALLKRRAKQILEARRPPPAPFMTTSAGLAQGYESNVELAGNRRGDFFTEESFGIVLQPRVTSWLKGEFAYDLLNTHYADLRDNNTWVNVFEGELQLQPHRRLRLDVGYKHTLLDFPFNKSSSFFNHRSGLTLSFTQTDWLTHKTAYSYQMREYDTRKARDANGVNLPNVKREDQRHTVSHELRGRFGRTVVRVSGQYYRNISNDQFNDFYDWEDIRVRGVISRVLNPQWIGVAIVSHERRNYQKRPVPAINVAERDNLLTLAGSVIHLISDKTRVTYSLTYRYQDSNDPRLDFIDWVNQIGVSVDF